MKQIKKEKSIGQNSATPLVFAISHLKHVLHSSIWALLG